MYSAEPTLLLLLWSDHPFGSNWDYPVRVNKITMTDHSIANLYVLVKLLPLAILQSVIVD